MDSPYSLMAIAREWLACFERKDANALVALYADDARHTSPKIRALHPETEGHLVGKDALLRWWSDAFSRLPNLRYQERTLTAGDGRVFMEYLRTTPGEPDLPVAEVLEILNGRIQASRVYHG